MSGDARDFNNMETRNIIKPFFLQGKIPMEIHIVPHITNWYRQHQGTTRDFRIIIKRNKAAIQILTNNDIIQLCTTFPFEI